LLFGSPKPKSHTGSQPPWAGSLLSYTTECAERFGLPPREPAGVVKRRPLNGVRVRMVVTGSPVRPGSHVGSKWRPSSERSTSGPGPRAGDQVDTKRAGG